MATGMQERKAVRRPTGAMPQALVLVSRSAAPIEEFEEDVAAIARVGEALAAARGHAGHPMKLGPPHAAWWSHRNGSPAWQLTVPLPAHVTLRMVKEAAAEVRGGRAPCVQLQQIRPEELHAGRERLPSATREVRVGGTPQHRGREVR